MVIATDLLQKYQNLISNPVQSEGCVSGECVTILHETSWTKIMVIRYQITPEICTIEIEVSLPHCIVDPIYPSDDARQEEARDFINEHLNHLNYLLRLQNTGFSLGVFSTESIWSAVLKIEGTPDVALFEAIIPPVT